MSSKELSSLSCSSFTGKGIKRKHLDPRESSISKSFDTEEDYCPDGVTQMDHKVWCKYAKQVKESEGFEFEDFPGICTMASIVPIYFHDSPLEQQILSRLATIAIRKYNEDQGTSYELEEVEKANASVCAGFMYYITFRAKVQKCHHLVKTFQAKVWDGIPASNVKVQFCRLKKIQDHKIAVGLYDLSAAKPCHTSHAHGDASHATIFSSHSSKLKEINTSTSIDHQGDSKGQKGNRLNLRRSLRMKKIPTK